MADLCFGNDNQQRIYAANLKIDSFRNILSFSAKNIKAK